jgi:hypothetical protein
MRSFRSPPNVGAGTDCRSCLRRPMEGLEVAGRPRPRRAARAMDRNAPSRPGLGLWRSGAPRCATALTSPRRRKSASPRRSCRSGRGGPRAPTRYPRGVSTGDFQEVLGAPWGKDCAQASRPKLGRAPSAPPPSIACQNPAPPDQPTSD